ncbi:MAG TPA: LysM peptidoglycan-binding domain-containing protein [Opitutaceae bacterium]|nr:LysM peptidoglycan-binding domain-containing protein [Opitutaceae bacterium]
MPGRSVLSRSMLLCALAAPFFTAPAALAQTDVADMREDVRGLTQRVGELSLRVEQLEHENDALHAKVAALGGTKDSVTTAQLNSAVAELNASIHSAVADSRTEILEKVATQMEVLAKQTNAALDSMAKPAARPAPTTSSATYTTSAGTAPSPAKAEFSENFPKEGISYTVAKGDSLGGIARKTSSKSADIIAANKLTDPSKIQAGQILFIPGGKQPHAP